MPPTFLLVAALILLGLIGPVLAAGLLVAALFPALRAGSLRALRLGVLGAAVGLAANVVLHLALEGTLEMVTTEGMLLGAGMGFSLVVIARGLLALAARREPEPPQLPDRAASTVAPELE